jgi:hypothetical protein
MAAQNHPPQRPATTLDERLAEHGLAALGGRAVGQQMEAASREEDGVELLGRQEAFQAEGVVLSGAQGVEVLGSDEDVSPGAVLVATDDGGAVEGSVVGAVFGVAEALAAIGVEEVGGREIASADGGVGLQGDADEAELEESGPGGSAVGGGAGEVGGWSLVGGVDGGFAHGGISGAKQKGRTGSVAATAVPPGTPPSEPSASADRKAIRKTKAPKSRGIGLMRSRAAR